MPFHTYVQPVPTQLLVSFNGAMNSLHETVVLSPTTVPLIDGYGQHSDGGGNGGGGGGNGGGNGGGGGGNGGGGGGVAAHHTAQVDYLVIILMYLVILK